VNRAVSRALVDREYAAALLFDPDTVLSLRLFAEAPYASLLEFARAADAALWHRPRHHS
jgi:hypothetical protein